MIQIERIKVNEEKLEFKKVFDYFKDTSTVFELTKIINNKYVIDYDLLKSEMPSKINDRPNLYGLYIKREMEDWKLMYVGQRKFNGILERLRQHLVSKHELTNSKLKNIEVTLNNKYKVGIKLFSIRPDSMRLYFEERLISNLELEWNQQKHKIDNQLSTIHN